MEEKNRHQSRQDLPSSLANLFFKVPEVADLVIQNLGPNDFIALVEQAEPALMQFFNGPGGGVERMRDMCEHEHYKRKAISRLPSLPRLLVQEWREKLMDKRIIGEDAEGDDTVSHRFGLRKKSLQKAQELENSSQSPFPRRC